ncbi:DUF4347 domain-containing protein [Leptolyngbya sp. NK1-12]|uniref:DUF4347 domain-containing protein n=1 Tax=Leptolyngbya sp. NK1-12 TaxID=2547451 RepID=A0AA96WGQ1_9CYAN|nr:DUF4347 domain-containing protein [Leptolyngbya sp. NK1-12]
MTTQSSVSFNGQIAFVDAGVSDSASLVSQFQPGTEVHLLASSQDAIEQITQVLASRSGISAVHLVSHGSSGALQLGAETISDLSEYDAELQQWSNALTADADILLYGCNVAAGEAGVAFANSLAQLTDADVAASDDLTGLGGDWTLEYQTGSIETAAIADTTYQGTLVNFFVTSTADTVDATDNVLTLREAITAANNQAGTDNIFFSVNGTITLTGGELGISSDVNIYGNGAPFVTISGNNASRVFNINSGTVLLSGLTVANGFAGGDNGGGILNSGILTVQFCTLQGNLALLGGGINNRGTLTVSGSTFSGNSAPSGGGIFNRDTVTVSGSTFSGNSAGDGGGISNFGTLTVNSSTFSGNSADGLGGGGIYNLGTVTVSGSTFSGNSASRSEGGGINNLRTLTVRSSYFLNNRANTEGGGISNRFIGTATLIGNVISQNSANTGGGVFNDGNTVNLQLNNISSNTTATGPDLFGAFVSGLGTPGSFGFNVIGKGGGFSGIVNGVNGDVILVP